MSVVQVFDSSANQPEVPTVADAPLELVETLPRDESLVVIEGSAPEGDARDPEAIRPGEEVQAIPPAGTSDRAPAFVKTLNDSSPYYERLRKKCFFHLQQPPLTCEDAHSLQIFRLYPN